MCLSTIISISYRRARQFTNLSAAPVSGTVSVVNVRWCMPNLYSLISTLGSMNVGLMQMHAFVAIMTKIKWMYNTQPRVRAHWLWTCLWSLSLSFNILETLILIPTPSNRAGNVSGYRCVSDCRSRGREFEPGPARSHTFVEIDHEIISTVILLPFRWIIQEGLLSVTSESMCTNYWLTACSSLPRKKCG